MTGDPGALPAFPSPSRGSQDGSYLVPRRSRAEGLPGAPLRGTREARGAGFHRHPRSSRVLAPLRLRGLGAPDTRERSTAPESCPSGVRGMVSPARGSLVGSEPGAAENLLGRDRAPTHSSLSTEPPTYFNPPPSSLPPSLLPLPQDSSPPSPVPQPCPAPAQWETKFC